MSDASVTSEGLMAGLRRALVATNHPSAHAPMQALGDKGLAHLHVRLEGTGCLARIPKQSQLGLDPASNLAYQRSCFSRAADSGHTPRLAGVLPPGPNLPRGALLVEEIAGRPAALPGDLPALAAALAALHRLPVPQSDCRAPLLNPEDPLRFLWREISGQALHLASVPWQASTRLTVEAALQELAEAVASPGRPQVHLIAFDAHPGNFLVRSDGSAVLVDLEKCRYGYPGLDLAHATLYTSTTWDPASWAELRLDDVLDFYAEWATHVDPLAAAAARPWHAALRQAMWLWSLTWCAKWRELSSRAADPDFEGEDWSASRSSDALVRHVRGRVDHYLSSEVIQAVRKEIDSVREAFA